MKTTINSVIRDGGNIIVHAQFVFPENEWNAAEAEAVVRQFTADRRNAVVAALAAMTPEEKLISKQIGVSPFVFAKYNPRP